MLTTHEIKMLIRAHAHSDDVAAIKIHGTLEQSLFTRNPNSGLMQSPGQVRYERDLLLSSNRALELNIARLRKASRNKTLLLKRLKAKIARLEGINAGLSSESFKMVLHGAINNEKE